MSQPQPSEAAILRAHLFCTCGHMRHQHGKWGWCEVKPDKPIYPSQTCGCYRFESPVDRAGNVDTERMTVVVCPHCLEQMSAEYWEFGAYDSDAEDREVQCDNYECERVFLMNVHVEYTYSTSRKEAE